MLSEAWMYSERGNQIRQRETAPAREVGGWWQGDRRRQEKDRLSAEGHEQSGLREVWHQQPKWQPPQARRCGAGTERLLGRASPSKDVERLKAPDSPWTPGKSLDFSESQLPLVPMRWIITLEGKVLLELDDMMEAKHLAPSLGHGHI